LREGEVLEEGEGLVVVYGEESLTEGVIEGEGLRARVKVASV